MRLTSISLFLLLLLVLLISIVFSKYLPLNREGFIAFNAHKPLLEQIYLPQYSTSRSQVYKLYDNLAYDVKNGNLLELKMRTSAMYYPTELEARETGKLITDPSNILSIYVVKRDGTTNANPISTNLNSNNGAIATDTEDSLIDKVSNSYGRWMYKSNVTESGKQAQNHVFYVSWGTDTYIHIIKSDGAPATPALSHLRSFYFISTVNGFVDSTVNAFATNVTTALKGQAASYTPTLDLVNSASVTFIPDDFTDDNGKVVKFTEFSTSRNVFKLSKFVYFDVTDGNLILTNNTGLLKDKVLSRIDGNVTTTMNDTMSSRPFTSWVTTDSGGNHIVYIASAKKTIILILKWDVNYSALKISNVFRFTENGYDNGTSATSTSTDPPPTTPGSFSEQYAQWLAYWNSVGGSTCNKYSEDYVLKTQIVPPVCPSCPSCSQSSGVCTSCGGQGGSGTQVGSSGQSGSGGQGGSSSQGVSADNYRNNQPNLTITENTLTTANPSTVGGAVTTSTLGVVSGAQSAVGTVGNVANNALSTTGGILQSAGSGATNLLQSAGSGATNLLQSAGSGTADLLRSAGSGVSNILTGNQNENRGGSGYGGSGGSGGSGSGGYGGYINPSVDNYNYNGALSNRSSNYIPVTADFSAFGR